MIVGHILDDDCSKVGLFGFLRAEASELRRRDFEPGASLGVLIINNRQYVGVGSCH